MDGIFVSSKNNFLMGDTLARYPSFITCDCGFGFYSKMTITNTYYTTHVLNG